MKTDIYTIDCTGNCCVGDEVSFERAFFTGKYPKSKFSHMERIHGLILKESYGVQKQQHTFTILDKDINNKFRIKGRNLYKNRVLRKMWDDEDKRDIVLKEKYTRGREARETREERIKDSYFINYDY